MGQPPQSSARAAVWPALALVLAAAAVTPWSIPFEHGIAAAAWLAPVLLLLIERNFRGRLGLPLVAAILIGSAYVAADGLLAGSQRPVFAVVFGLLQWLPFALDRWLHVRLSTGLRTFVFPLALTAVDTLLARYSPMATWGSPAYAHVDELIFVQFASITGMAGLTFATAWTASVAVEVIASLRAGYALPRVTYVWGVLAACVVLFGSLRLDLTPSPARMVRVAGVTQNGGTPGPLLTQKAIANMTDAQRAAYRPQLMAGLARLDERTRREAAAGAQIVVWNEQGARVFEEDKAAMLADASALARETHIYLLAVYVAYPRSSHMPFSENRAALFAPSGALVFDYAKAHPIPGNPYDAALPSGEPVPVTDTPLGRIATVICYDSDFPLFTAGVGRAGADLWLVPAFDWEGIHSIHSRMAQLRAVEEGASMFRITSHAESIASDPYGRVLATADDQNGANDGTMIAMLPAQHAFVLAPWVVGSIFPLTIVGLIVLVLYAFFGAKLRYAGHVKAAHAVSALALVAALLTPSAARAESVPPAAMATIEHMLARFNAGDMTGAARDYVAAPMIVDEVPPFVWTGPRAAFQFGRDFDALKKAAHIANIRAVTGTVTQVRIGKSSIYVVVPTTITYGFHGKIQRETGQWAFTLRPSGATWKIVASSWAVVTVADS